MATMTALGPEYPPGWCLHHEREHDATEWGDLCESPHETDEQFADRYRRLTAAWEAGIREDLERRRGPWRWLKQATVCWWKHRTRPVGAGVWVSNYCWACTGRGR